MDSTRVDQDDREREDAGGIGSPDIPGWVYVLRNRSMPHRIKIGYSTADPMLRARELSNATGVPEPFTVVAAFETPWPRRVEAEVHRRLAERRVSPNREFFDATPDEDVVTPAEMEQYFSMVITHAAEHVEIEMQREAFKRRYDETYWRHMREEAAFRWRCMRRNRPREHYPKRVREMEAEAIASIDRSYSQILDGCPWSSPSGSDLNRQCAAPQTAEQSALS